MGESSFVMAVGVSELNDRPDNATKGTLRFNNATAMRTSLKKYKFGFLVFIAIIPSYTYYVKCTQTLLNLHSKGPYSSSEREIKFRCCLITFSMKHDISHLLVIVVQKRQNKVQKSVMPMQSCCFAY